MPRILGSFAKRCGLHEAGLASANEASKIEAGSAGSVGSLRCPETRRLFAAQAFE